MRGPRRDPSRTRWPVGNAAGWWAAAAALALLAAAQWLDRPSVEYLAVCIVATIAALGCTAWLRGGQRLWALAWCAAQLVLSIAATQYQRQLSAVTGHWREWRRAVEARALEALRGALDETVGLLVQSANDAVQAPGAREAAFAHVRELANASAERGVVLYRADSAFAWAGRLRVPTDSLTDDVGVVASPFYLALYATARRGDRRAVATAILSALPPGDRLTNPIARRVAVREGLDDFVFTAPRDTIPVGMGTPGEVLAYRWRGHRLLDARPAPLVADQVLLRVSERARLDVGVLLAVALACFIVGAWRGTRAVQWRLSTLGIVLLCTGLIPLNSYSNRARLFDATFYYTPLGRALTASAGALAITSALLLLGLFTLLRRGRRPSRWTAGVVVLLVAGLGPFLLRDLARGIHLPAYGVSASLWLIWEIPLCLAAAAVLLAGAGAGGVLLGRTRGVPTWLAPALAGLAAVVGVISWEPPGQWPWWYTFLWIAAIAALALRRQARGLVISAAAVAALGAVMLVWGRTARARVALAEQDLQSLGAPDPDARLLLERLGDAMQADVAPASRAGLLQRYAVSDLAAAGYPAAFFAWPTDSGPTAAFRTASFAVPMNEVARVVADARRERRPLIRAVAGDPAVEQVLAAPDSLGNVIAVVTAPKTRLIPPDPFIRILGLDLAPEGEPPYTVQLSPLTARAAGDADRIAWQEHNNTLHGDLTVRTGSAPARAHVEVELRPLTALVQRGTLIVLLDLAIIGLLWLLSVVADGGVGRWLRARRRTWGRSYRLRLTLALFAFFVIPALAFAVWSYGQLSADAAQARELLLRETLRAVTPADSAAHWVSRESTRLATPLLVYSAGELRDASDPLYESLAPVGRFLRYNMERLLVIGDEDYASLTFDIGPASTLFGFRSIDHPGLPDLVLAAPARADELPLQSRRRDLGILVLFATAVGAAAALWLSGIAARELARPIGTLREAALSIASGEQMPPLEGEPTVEFHPVFTAFRRMAADLAASRAALEESQRRTAAILRNVASGVIAVDPEGRVVLANPRADDLLHVALPPRTVLADAVSHALTEPVLRFLRGDADEEAFEIEIDQRQLRGHLTRLARGGAVVTLDDVTELARAQRVLAWGEMARQIAHEIKNPLTPIRLGVQHLRRARADQRVDFDRVLEQNVTRILGEIDRLDEIARAFSRYGSAPGERAPAVPTDVAAVVRDVVALESMAAEGQSGTTTEHDGIQWHLEGTEAPVLALAREDELREVLLNVFENARLAGAQHVGVDVGRDGQAAAADEVVLTVRDDGHGIPEEVLPRIFEPHFSTRTSGSGLGLAISRQIIDGWGGNISVASTHRAGTTVRIVLRAVS